MAFPHESPPPDGDVSRQTGALIAIWVLFGVSSVVMVLRVFAQATVIRRPSLDDGLMIAAWICQAVNSALNTVSVYWGIGRHAFYLTREQYVTALKYDVLAVPWAALCPMFGRISFIVFLLVFIMTASRARKRLLWALIVAQVIFNTIPVIFTFVQCQPPSHLWDPFHPGSCWDSGVVIYFGYLQGGVNAATDLCLTVMGITLVVSLNLRLYAKITLSLLLSLSIIAMVASILKTVKIEDTTLPDLTYHFAFWIHWYMLENAVVIITASIPKMRPLLIIIRQKYAESKYQHGRRTRKDVERSWSPQTRLSKYISLWSNSGSGTRDTEHSNAALLTSPYTSLSGTTVTNNNNHHHRQPRRQRSIYSLPYRSLSRRSRSRRLSSDISLTSLSRLSSRRWGQCPSEDSNLTSRTDTPDFLPPRSPRMTYRTVITGGGPVPPSVPPFVLSSTPASGRTSRASMRGNGNYNNQGGRVQSPRIPVDIEASGPICIWQTKDVIIEFEEASEDLNQNNSHNNNHSSNNGLGRSGPGNSQAQRNESEAEELQLFDVGAILPQSKSGSNRSDPGLDPPS